MEIKKIRKFNQYYTGILGVFDQHAFDLPYSMAEVRILGEISRHQGITAHEISKYLRMNKSYLSRILSKLEKAGYLLRHKDTQDRRVQHLYLTEAGQELNSYVEAQSDQQMEAILAHLKADEVRALVGAMSTIETILYQVIPNELEEK